MCFIHCHKCGWEQDDFWSIDGYNPCRFIKENILKGFIENPDGRWGERFDKSIVTNREALIHQLNKYAKHTKEMKWTTQEQYRKDRKNDVARCPKCGSDDLDID